ncbi:MAG: alanine dehydrogenase [Thermoplasmata archaeon]|nr:alanine dehydrogenase [Thermoplasmata archaeon]MCJ7562420.1 alanine dehydrogenase [Thermoplasmata archaeon]
MPTQHAPVKTLLLTGKQIMKLLDMKDVLAAVEDAFRHKGLGKIQMPPKAYLFYEKFDGDLRTMPSYVEDMDVSAVKIVNVHPQNAKNHGMRTVMALLVLVDPHTGAPLAVMDATHITDMRTGGASAIASKYLARPNPKVVGIIGAGNQAKTQMLALITQFGSFDQVKVYDLYPDKAKERVREFRRKYKDKVPKIKAVATAKDAVVDSDIIVTCTSSRAPIVMDEWVKDGAHINCIGADAPGKQEMDPKVLKRAFLVIDDWEQASHSGEINVPLTKGELTREDVNAEIGEVVAGLKTGRTNDEQVTVFCSTGLGVQDSLTAKIVYDIAKKQGIGKSMQLVL